MKYPTTRAPRVPTSCWTIVLILLLAVLPGLAARIATAAQRSPDEQQLRPIENVRLTTGLDHSCLLAADGTARCWGDNSNGQLGSPFDTDRYPVAVGAATPLTDVAALSAGYLHTCALVVDGTARCWGYNSVGQLGDGSTTTRMTPVDVGSGTPISTIVALEAGEDHTCALLADSSARCWGGNSSGQLGAPGANGALVTVGGTLPLTTIVSINVSSKTSCAVLADGTGRCWGNNSFGQFGNGTTSSSTTPITVGGGTPLTNIVALSSGGSHTCALLADGGVRCWGDNFFGALGDGTTTSSLTPVVVGGGAPLKGAVAISAGQFHTCALLFDGSARCWGYSDYGQLGDGTTETRLSPTPVGGASPLVGLTAISAGRNHTCAAHLSGVTYCWGYNAAAFGSPGAAHSSEPMLVPGLPGLSLKATTINAANEWACATLADTTARCWGNNQDGQLGDGTQTDRLVPYPIGGTSPLTGVLSISGGVEQTCATLENGLARCWGKNQSGQLGDGTFTSRTLPTLVGGTSPLTRVVGISSGREASCAAIADGTARCWGHNSYGQLGNGSPSAPISVPVTVGGTTPLTQVLMVGTGSSHSCALLADGTARCWGDNNEGQLGAPNAYVGTNRFAVVGGNFVLRQIVSISTGFYHTCALIVDGTVRCWGYNANGQLGIGFENFLLYDYPQVVGYSNPLTNVVSISAGGYHTCALLADGTARCWGRNQFGELGDGTLVGRPSPTVVGGATPLRRIVAISAGTAETCALLADGTARCWGFNREGSVGDGTTSVRTLPTQVQLYPMARSSGAVVQPEGNRGLRTVPVTVTLSAPSAMTATVQYSTEDGTALAGSDYISASGTLTFTPGMTAQVLLIAVYGDVVFEDDEALSVRLFNPSQMVFATSQITITLLKDERLFIPLVQR